MDKKDISLQKIKDLYLQTLIEIKNTVQESDIDELRNLNKLVSYINDIENRIVLKTFYGDSNNPIKDTNLIILACEYNQIEVLGYLFDDQTKILDALSTTIERNELKPSDSDKEGHTAFYYAIRSGNVNLLNTLINQWPGKYFGNSANSEELDSLISKAYEELKLKNVQLSKEVEIFVEDKLINLRFFHKKNQSQNVKPSLNNVKKRIDIVIKSVESLEKNYSGTEEVDEEFLFISKFIAQNLHVLKRLLKSTYDKLPWEQMEFCLVAFISSRIKRQEINFVYNSVLNKQKLLTHLKSFVEKLNKEKFNIKDKDIGNELPKDSDTLKGFEEIYNDYEQIKDVYSIEQIKDYVELVSLVSLEENLGKVVVERALQVTGEYLKNTFESPHLSDNVSYTLLAALSKNTREIIIWLRNRLSHAIITLPTHEREYLLGNKVKIWESKSSKFLSSVKNDFVNLKNVITDILYDNKIKIIRTMLKKISDSKDLSEAKEFTRILDNTQLKDVNLESVNTQEIERTQKLIEELENKIKDQTDYEKELFNKIKNVISVKEIKLIDIKIRHVYGHSELKELINCVNRDRNIWFIKTLASEILSDIASRIEHKDLEEVVKLVLKIYNSVRLRLQHNNLYEINTLFYRIFYTMDLKVGNIESIAELKKNLEIKLDLEHFQNEINDIFSDIIKRSSKLSENSKLSKKLDERRDAYEKKYKSKLELDNLLSKLEIGSGSKHDSLDKFNSLIEMLKLTKKQTMNLKKYYNASQWKECKKSLAVLMNYDSYWNLITATENFVKDGKFDSVSRSIKGLFSSKSLKKDLKENLDKILEEISQEKEAKYKKQFNQRLSILEDLYPNLNENRKLELIQNYENNKELKAATEMLVLDLTAFLEEKEGRLDKSLHVTASLLDKYCPILVGKALRNNLAHGNALANILPSDPSIAVISSALRLVKEGKENLVTKKGNTLIGQPILDNLPYLENHYRYNLDLITNQKEMFNAAKNGDLEKVKVCISKGADIKARDINKWTTLHFSAAGDNLEVIKFFLDQNLSIDIKDVNGKKPLHVAASFGGTKIVKYFIEDIGIDVNCFDKIDNNKQTLLHIAAENDHKGIVEMLIAKGANVNAEDEYGQTPLHIATENDHKEVVKILLQKGAKVNVKTNKNCTPLYYAAQNGYLEVVNAIIENKAKVNVKNDAGLIPLHIAAKNGHKEVIEVLLKNGADVNAKTTDQGTTPLHYAAKNANKAVIEVLLKNGADVNAKTTDQGATPLHIAAQSHHKEVVEILLKNRADVNAKTTDQGATPLHEAAESGHKEIIKTLLEVKSININAQTTYNGWMPLHYAVLKGHKVIVNVLIANGAKVNALAKDNLTLLHLAAQNGHKEVVKVLIQKEAEVNAQTTEKGWMPLHYAAQNGHKEVVEILLKNIADVNAKSTDKDATPLHIAAQNGNTGVVKTLLEAKGIKVNVKDKDKDNGTPLHAAAQNGHREIVKVLLKNGAIYNAINSQNKIPLDLAKGSDIKNLLNCIDKLFKDVQNGRKDNVSSLLEGRDSDTLKAILHTRNRDEKTLLQVATIREYRSIAELLIAELRGNI